MKILKVYEYNDENKTYQFEIGDYVRYGNRIYTIDHRQIKYKSNGDSYCVYGLDDGEISISLVGENELKALPDYEIAALKYNL
jgi:hypothetical protein